MHLKGHILRILACALCLTACTAAPAASTARLATVALYDGGTLWGGQELFILTNGVCFTRVIRPPKAGESGIQERRCKLQLAVSDLQTLEQMLEKRHFSSMAIKDRTGVPDETRTTIRVRLTSGVTHEQSKWTRDPHPDFDPIYQHLLRLVQRAQKAQPVYEGQFVYRWKPEGFE